VGRDSSVGTATRYELGSPVIASRWEARLSVPAQIAPGPTYHPVDWVPGLVTGGTVAEAWRWPRIHIFPEVKESVEV